MASTKAQRNDIMLTLEIMHAMWPNGNNSIPGLVEGIVAAAPAVFAKYGLNIDLVIAHAMAQFSHECGAGNEMIENINYTAKRACQVWPSRFQSEADCFAKVGSFAGDPDFRIKLIDNVYGGRNGNRPGTHDGSCPPEKPQGRLTDSRPAVQCGAKTETAREPASLTSQGVS
jgi:predicted chitinase